MKTFFRQIHPAGWHRHECSPSAPGLRHPDHRWLLPGGNTRILLAGTKWVTSAIGLHGACGIRATDNITQSLPSVSLTPVANLPPVSTTPAVQVAKFSAGTGTVDTSGGAPWNVNIPGNFQKMQNDPNIIFIDLGEDDLWKKNLKQKNLVTMSLWACD